MNKVLKRLYDEKVPSFNETVTNGFVNTVIDQTMDYVDKVIRSAMTAATPLLEYHGLRRLDPIEEARTITSKGNQKNVYDIAGTDVYKVELLFTYNGDKIPNRYLYLPFTREAGKIYISGTPYHLVPVLTDTVISPSDNNIFVRLLKDKLLFHSIQRNIIKNNSIYIGQVIYSEELFRVDVRNNELGKVINPIALYLFGKDGVVKTFMKTCGFAPIITTIDKTGPYEEEYDIYTSTKKKPRGLKIDVYHGTDIAICIPKNNNASLAKVDGLVTSFIYAFDILPHFTNDMVDTINSSMDGKTKTEEKYWKIIMSKLVFKDSYSVDRGYASIIDHYKSLESYIDPMTSEKLKESGLEIKDFFTLIEMIIDKYRELLSKGKEYTNNIYNRYIDVLYYLLFVIVVGINRTINDIGKYDGTILLMSKIERLFNINLSSRSILKIASGEAMNISLIHADTSSDNMYMKFTSIMELQERGKGVSRGTNNQFPINTRVITGPDLYIGSVLFLPKNTPTPKVRINPFAKFTPTGRINPTPEQKYKLDLLDNMFAGRIVSDANINKLINENGVNDDIMDDL